MFQTNPIMSQENIHYLNNIEEVLVSDAWEKLCHIIKQLQPKTGNPLAFLFVSVCYINIISS